MPALSTLRNNPFLWLACGLLLGIVLSAAIFWGFLAFGSWKLTDSEKVIYGNANRTTYLSGEIESIPESNSQSLTQIEKLLNNLDDFSQFAQFYAFLANADEALLLDLLEASKSIASASRRKAAQSAIVQGIASINPRVAFERVRAFPLHQQDDLLASIFREWSISSLNQAVETASTLDGRSRHLALKTILKTRDDLSDTSRRDIADRLGDEDLAMSLLGEEQAMALMDDPRKAWNTLVNDGLKNRSRVDAYVRIAVEWAALEGLEVLNEIAETLIKDVDDYNHIRDSTVTAVAQTNVVDAFEYVSKLDGDMQQQLLRPVALAWANIDPTAALKAIDELDNDVLTNMIARIIVTRWTRSNPKEILPLLDNYSKSVQMLAMERVATSLVRTTPQEALRLIQEWGNAGFDMTSVARSVIDEWSQLGPQAALEWLLSENSEDWMNYADMMEKTVRGLATVNPTRAFEVAMKQPLAEEYMSGTEVWVILELSRTDLDKALELLPQVRESSKILASMWVGEALIESDKPFEALDLAKHLPEDRRDSFQFNVTKKWGELDALQLFETLDSFSETRMQSIAAKSLIWNSRWDSILTTAQLEVVRSFLTEEDAEEVESWRNL